MAQRSRTKQMSAVELRPDGWERFERAVDAALHTPPQHRTTKKAKRSGVKNKRKR